MSGNLSLGVGPGVYIPPPGMPGSPWKGESATGIKSLTVDQLKTFVEFGTISTLNVNMMVPILTGLMFQTQNGLQIEQVARTHPSLSQESRAVVLQYARTTATFLQKALPVIQKAIPESFRQLDQAADLLAKKSNFQVKFFGPVYYSDEMRMGVLYAERLPEGTPAGTYDFTKYSKMTPRELSKISTSMYNQMKPILEIIDPALKGRLAEMEAEIKEQFAMNGVKSSSLGAAPVFALLAAIFTWIAAHIDLTVVAGLAITALILGGFALAALSQVTGPIASIVGPIIKALEDAFKMMAPPLLGGIQWIMIFVGLGLGIGLIFAGPTLVNRLESMFTGAIREAGGGRREVPAPRGGGSPIRAEVGF